MKTYISDIIPKIKQYSLKLDNLTTLTNKHWVSIGDIGDNKRVYIFRNNGQLLISNNGIVEKGSWEYLGNKSLLIETTEGSYLLKHVFFDQNIIALQLDSTNNYAFFVNENKSNEELNSVEDVLKFLTANYLTNKNQDGFKISDDEQKEWIANPNKCPGCGFLGVFDKSYCPGCGLYML